MLNRHRTSPAGAVSTAGMLLSLASALPDNQRALARAANRLAHRLSDGASTRADLSAASDMLARLLDETDTGICFDEDGLLDEGFDA